MKLSNDRGAARASVAVFFSYKTSLERWADAGLFGREVSYLRALGEKTGALVLVTYGRPSARESELEHELDDLVVLSNRRQLPDALYSLVAPIVHYRTLCRADVLRSVQLRGAWTAVAAKYVTGRPLVVRTGYAWSRFVEAEGRAWFRRQLALALERVALRSADLVLVASSGDRAYLSQRHSIAADKLQLVPNPIDVNRFTPGPTAERERGRVLYVGRLEPQKNVGALIDAIRKVDGARLLVVGDGSVRRELENKAMGAPVEFAGALPNAELPQVMRRAQVFVLPSLYEGSPKALLEAMACGLAVVAADCPAVREVVSTHENGILARPEASSLADALKSTLADAALRERLGDAARRYVCERHDERAVSDREAQLLHDLASSRRRSPESKTEWM